ncbi:SRPBCC family protein [Sphingomonas sp. SRS2]|uniref:SRPBCC family protein n=1 Tax=Sphingomonas sp. SRS2 TaxID=133190 RepID=UPI0006184539|nr:SRPBCC family protein [Sphingomonas sp. SRS2]KKC27011.1 hypothetical protein WP12_06010 [Sphingomonas sp. SRS2]
MYTLSHAIPVNPDGIEPKLTREQVWAGLALKAVDAKPFVDGMTQCDLIERTDTTIKREITFRGAQSQEFITLFEPVKVQFERLDGTGWIDNVISDSESGLVLSFTFGVRFPGITEDTPEETAKGDSMRGAYVGAVAATLAKVREMVANGEL